MNNKGSVPLYLFMIGIVFFLLALALAPALAETINGDEVRGTDGLNCSSALIDNDDKAVCYQLDTLTPLYVGIILGLGGLLFMRMAT